MPAYETAMPLPRVLVVDDNADHLELISRYLQKYWIALSFALSANEGWKILQSEKIDLVILDHSLPDFDGVDFLSKLRQACFNQPIILLTTQSDHWLIELAMRKGANYFVQKTAMGCFLKKVGEIVARELKAIPHKRAAPRLRLPEFVNLSGDLAVQPEFL
jgi:CheY-like chemotaxis protein